MELTRWRTSLNFGYCLMTTILCCRHRHIECRIKNKTAKWLEKRRNNVNRPTITNRKRHKSTGSRWIVVNVSEWLRLTLCRIASTPIFSFPFIHNVSWFPILFPLFNLCCALFCRCILLLCIGWWVKRRPYVALVRRILLLNSLFSSSRLCAVSMCDISLDVNYKFDTINSIDSGARFFSARCPNANRKTQRKKAEKHREWKKKNCFQRMLLLS